MKAAGGARGGATLVIGGTGKTGRRIVERLTARGLPVIAATRTSAPPFDWQDQSTWAPALQGIAAVYISYYPDITVPGAVDAIRTLVSVAVESGVRRLVLLSGRGEEEAQRAEQVVRDSGIEWTIVRCAWFSQNFSENYLLDPILEGEVVLPVSDVPEPFVDAEDIADVAAAALVEDGHAGQTYELTGPRLITFPEAITAIAEATGREIHYHPITVEEYGALLAERELPDGFHGLMTYLFREVLDGRNAYLSDGVQRALGREPRDFGDYVRTTAASGVWDTVR